METAEGRPDPPIISPPPRVPSVAKAPAGAAAPAHTEEAIKPTATTLAPIAPAGPAPAPTPETYEVQSCGTECDYPCSEDCGQTA